MAKMQTVHQQLSTTVVCRPPWTVLVTGLFYAAFAVLYPAIYLVPNKDGHLSPLALLVFMGLFAGALGVKGFIQIVSFFCQRVIADSEGIRWRNLWGGWRSATWEEVTDYYQAPAYSVKQGNRVLTSVVVTTRGIVQVHPDTSPESQTALQNHVQAMATEARVQGWALLGIRRVDPFPKVFRYWDRAQQGRLALFIALTISLYIVAGIGSIHLVDYLKQFLSPEEMQPIYQALAAAFLVGSIIPGLFLRAFIIRWKRRHEVITATPETLRYQTGPESEIKEVPWSQITDYFYKGEARYSASQFTVVLPGADEQQISWSPLLLSYPLLLAIVHRYAPRPAHREHRWRSQATRRQANGSDPTTWQGGAVGVGDRTFSYKSPMIQVLIGTMLFFNAVFAVVCFKSLQEPNTAARWIAAAMLLFCLLGTVWMILSYFLDRIETDDTGITQHGIFGKKHLYWYTVADYHFNKDAITIRGKNGVRITASSTLVGFKELKAEIERLAPPPQTGWQKNVRE